MPAETAPTEAEKQAHVDVINAEVARIQRHQKAGRFAEADAAITKLVDSYGNIAQLVQLRGLNTAMQGRVEEGADTLKQALSIAPEDVSIMVDYGSLLAKLGRLDDAAEVFQAAADTSPKNALAYANLGAALILLKECRLSIRSLQAALDLDDSLIDTRLNLAQAFIRMGNFQSAIDPLFRVLAQDPQSAAAHSHLALALFRRERHEAAEHHARRAMELAPNAAEPKLHFGSILGAGGRMDDAAEALISILEDREFGMAATGRLVALRKATMDSPEVAALERFSKVMTDASPADARSSYHFACGKVAQDLGDYDAAADHYAKANAATAEIHPFDRDTAFARMTRVRDFVGPEFIARHRNAGLTSNAPVFICGLPRSGTTLMKQMFSRHPAVQAGGEMMASQIAFQRNPNLRAVMEREADPETLTDDDLTRLGEDYVEFVHNEGLKADVVTDKMPANYNYIGLLSRALPRARFVLMRRHPLDCLLSNYTQNFGSNQTFSTSFETLGAMYNLFDETATYWATLMPDQVRVVNYEDIVADAERQMRTLLDFGGLEWSDGVLDHTASSRNVNTASVAQVRQPIYKTSVKRWERYGEHIQGLALAVKEHLSAEELGACGVGRLQ